jgi:hypothetical protein
MRSSPRSAPAPPDDLSWPDAEVARVVGQHYPQLATDLLKPLLNLLCVSRESCGGDADKFLIMLVVALRTTTHPAFAASSQDVLLSGQVPVFPGFATNVRSIADSLKAPRETIRRKANELIEAGWIVRDGTNLYFTAKAYQQLARVREAIEAQAISNYRLVRGMLSRSGAPAAARPAGPSDKAAAFGRRADELRRRAGRAPTEQRQAYELMAAEWDELAREADALAALRGGPD